MNVYLDIDGVLLANDLNATNHVHEFLKVSSQYTMYWLTTHCQGDASTAYRRLETVLEPRTMKLLQNVKPTKWVTAKTEAIDFEQPFVWFDDDLFEYERLDLIKHEALDNWIQVDLSKDPDQLAKFVTSFPLAQGIY
jgi:hypothetical protein